MKEFTIKVRTRDFWISLVLGMYAAMGAFISLSREATIDNSPDIDLTSTIMLYTRTMYRSFSLLWLSDFSSIWYCRSNGAIKNEWQNCFFLFCLQVVNWLP